MSRHGSTLWMVILLLAFGCTEEKDTYCIINFDCGSGNQCCYRQCIPEGDECIPPGGDDVSTDPMGCASDLECGVGLICLGGRCLTGQCNEERECREGWVCDEVSHTCRRNEESGCLSMGCPEGQICDEETGSCTVPPERSCTSQSDCETGFCVNGECRDVECIDNQQCSPDEQCNADSMCEPINPDCEDLDEDGYGYGHGCLGPDCDDGDPRVNPGIDENATNLCGDGIDNDCNGLDALCGETDLDEDGFSTLGGDCDDTDARINPGREEAFYSGLDEDCDPLTDDWDADGDGFAVKGQSAALICLARSCGEDGHCAPGEACDSGLCVMPNGAISSGLCAAGERCSLGRTCRSNACFLACEADAQCVEGFRCLPADTENPVDDEGRVIAGACIPREPESVPQALFCEMLLMDVSGNDCNDANAEINPAAEEILGDEVDNDCNAATVDTDLEGDRDGDGYSEWQRDCNDDDPDVNPSVNEVPYNGRDDDCNPATPDDDLDEDGFIRAEDCNDDDASINPSQREIFYNGIDEDCSDATVDEDADGDGFAADEVGGPDCNDRAGSVHPNAPEVTYNGEDDDCDLNTPDDDLDEDGFCVRPEVAIVGCGDQIDCDDSNPDVNPFVIENTEGINCSDGIDNDCRGGDVLCDPLAVDTDGDGVPDDYDCDPGNPDVPGQREIIGNMRDDDCDPETPDLLPRCVDDEFDVIRDNSRPQSATLVEDGNTEADQYVGLVLCPLDFDWYRIDIEEGDGLEVDLRFDQIDGDLDLRLYRYTDAGIREFIDSSLSSTSNETVFLRTASGGRATYLIEVSRYGSGEDAVPYSMTVNVFDRCADDLAGPTGEQNDTRLTAVPFPTAGETRRICDYDSDWFRFSIEERQVVRLDLLFETIAGDLDMQLLDSNGVRIGLASTIQNNELIEENLDSGEYFVRVYGFGGNQNHYILLMSPGQIGVTDSRLVNERELQDYERNIPGRLEHVFEFQAPPGALIRELTVQDLHIDHSWLPDLRVTAQWDGVEHAVLWNQQGDALGQDGGEDDDDLPFTEGNIDFDNRTYGGFAGLPATGTFTLVVEDRIPGDSGRLTALDVSIQYVVP